MNSNYSKEVIAISKFISNFFNPFTSFMIFFLYFSFIHLELKDAIQSFLKYLGLVFIPIILWIFYNVKEGNYTNMDVSNRKQRNSLYVVIVALLGIFILIEYFFYEKIDLVLICLFLLIVAMQLSNFYIKSSMHTSLYIYVAALFFALNVWLGIFWFVLAIVVGITRIILQRHTPKEVLMGAVIGGFFSLLYLYLQLHLIT